MKIIHFIASIDKSSGGTTTYMQLLSSELRNQLHIIIGTGMSPNPEELKDVEVRFFDTRLIRWFLMQKEFDTFLENEKPDLVHVNGIWNPENWLFQKAAQSLGIKVILSPHGMLNPYILKHNPVKKKIALALYQDKAIMKVDFLHATANSESLHIKKLGYHQTMSIIPNGIKMQEFPSKLPIKLKLPRKIIFLSRITIIKGIEYLIEAWSQLNKNHRKDWIIEIIGNGEASYIKSLQQKINTEDLQGQIVIKDPVFGKEKIKVFREASLFVLPTHSENFGIVVAEALASYTPVITTVGTPWEELNTCRAGWWIEIGAKPLKEALTVAMQTTASELIQMGQNGRNLIEEKYSIEAVGKQMCDFYRQILN